MNPVQTQRVALPAVLINNKQKGEFCHDKETFFPVDGRRSVSRLLTAGGQKAAAPAPESTAAPVAGSEAASTSAAESETTGTSAAKSETASTPAAESEAAAAPAGESGSSDAVSGATSTAAAESGADVDMVTSASVVPGEVMEDYTPKGFTDGEAKKALFVVADPRYATVTRVLANSGRGIQRDLFKPV